MLSRRSLLAATAAILPIAARAQRFPEKRDDTTAAGFTRDVLARWGDRVAFDAPPFAPYAPTVAAAATQFGWDGMVLGIAVGPQAEDGVARGVLAVAHPTCVARMMFPGGQDRPEVAAAAQGASLLNLEKRGGRWLVADGGYQSRRLTASTLCALTGPASGTTGDAIQGLLAVACGCVTPWGTLLLGEGDAAPWFGRLRSGDARFADSGRAVAFGWVAELDPLDPQAVPAKRTALGRFDHSGLVATIAGDGRAVVFMTDAAVDGFLYRFVSTAPAGPGVLDDGVLSVAVPAGNWAVRFVRLPDGVTSLIAARDAARQVGAEAFDAPAGMAVAADGVLLLTCRGNPARAAVDSLNPRLSNPDGHVLLFRPDGRDPAAERFAGEIALLGGDPDQGAGGSAWISRPSSLAVDASGGIWVGCEGSGMAFATAGTYAVQGVYRPPVGAAMGGVAITPDGRMVLSAVRHPGATADASFDHPATRWPSLRPDMPPQTVVVGVSRVG